MATIALPRLISSPRPRTTSLKIEKTATATACAPVPNKHIPICPPGPAPTQTPDTPPQSPLSRVGGASRSLLFPPTTYTQIKLGDATVYELDVADAAAAIKHISQQPLPDPSLAFPWLHGLHPSNHVQQAFFLARRRGHRTPPAMMRELTIVKADGDITRSRLKGAVPASELLSPEGETPGFRDVDPVEGFSIRNFHIQTAKLATVSDIIVYGNDTQQVHKTASALALAQQALRLAQHEAGHDIPPYSTFVCVAPFTEFEERHANLVAINSHGQLTGSVINFCYQERLEMCIMSKATEIAHNVWLGPTPDPALSSIITGSEKFDVQVECGDLLRQDHDALRVLVLEGFGEQSRLPLRFEFPSSGSIMAPTWSHAEADGILETCKWIYCLAHGQKPREESEVDDDGDKLMDSTEFSRVKERKVLIHCADGYTESSMLALAYSTYATGVSVPAAWLGLHTLRKRNFFAYASDVALLSSIAPRLLSDSPLHQKTSLLRITELAKDEPQWFKILDGSLPSRITDYMYLGNLIHANNPHLLRHMGIGQVLSVGERVNWLVGELEQFGEDNVLCVRRVQDNGVDPLGVEFERCLKFIAQGRAKKTATLVHCRVGVSRSATICIAEVMRSFGFSLPEAYCFVRARRLNVIIQPHLRFAYELLKWEEKVQRERTGSFERAMEWAEVAREIAALNKPYSK